MLVARSCYTDKRGEKPPTTCMSEVGENPCNALGD